MLRVGLELLTRSRSPRFSTSFVGALALAAPRSIRLSIERGGDTRNAGARVEVNAVYSCSASWIDKTKKRDCT